MAILELGWTLAAALVAGNPSVMITDAGTRIVVGTSDSCIVALAGDGSEVWRTPVGGVVSIWPAIDDVPGLGKCILVATDDGDVLCLSSAGEIRWTTRVEDSFSSFNSVSVVRGGQTAAIVATGRRGLVTGLTSSGEVVWQFRTHADRVWGSRGVGPAAIGDIDSDGRDEVVFSAADGYVYCVSSDGALRWNAYVGNNSQWSGPVMVDLGDGPRVLAGGTDDLVHCIGPGGEVLWTQQGAGAGYVEIGISVGDIDGDGASEIVFVHQGRALQAIDAHGGMLWSTLDYVGGDQPFGPSIADVTGDGSAEILLTQRGGPTLFIVGGGGSLLDRLEIPGGMAGAPVVTDVDDDGLLEVLVVAQKDGALTCYNTSAPAGANAVQWPTSRGDFDGRANLLADAEPVGRSEATVGDARLRRTSPLTLRLGTNEIVYEPEERAPDAKYVIEVTVTGPDRVPSRAAIDDDRRIGTDVEVLEPGDYVLTATLVDARSGDRLGTLEEQVAVGLFTEERVEVERLLARLARVAARTEDLRPELLQIHRLRRFRWMGIEEQFGSYESLPDAERRQLIAEVGVVVSALRREIACQRARIDAAERCDGPVDFLPWQLEHPWMDFAPESDPPPSSLLTEVAIRTDGRGHDALAVQIANVHADPLDVRVWMDPLTDETGAAFDVVNHLELRQVTWIPTPGGRGYGSYRRGGMGADALPELGNAGIVRLGASSSERLWIDVLTRDLQAGTYATTLHMRALTQTGATWDVPVRWTVEPIALPEAMPLKFCNWARGYTRHFAHAEDAALEDMQDHHTSVFYGGPTIRVKYDGDGNLVQDTGWDEQDDFLAKLRPGSVLLYHGLPIGPVEGAPGEFSEAWKKAYAAFLPQWIEHLSQEGFGYESWAFYPVDEPGLRGGVLIERLERIARFVKGLDRNVQFYTDPYRGMTVADHKRMVDVLDIVQPAQYGVVQAENSDRIDYLKTTDQTHWIYDARARVKEAVAPTYYWEQIWTAWEIGFTGIGYWTYCTTRFDLWGAEADYVLVYQGAQGPVPSRRWQAVRIGIEDYARMARLRDAIATARDRGQVDAADRAERRLGEMVAETKAARWEPGLVARIRDEIIDLTLELAR